MAKKKSHASSKRRSKRSSSASQSSSPVATNLSTSELEAELRRRQRGHQKLVARREKLIEELRKVDDQIRESGGTVIAPGRKRPQNESNLADALHSLLKGRTMGVTEAADAVQAAGYRTSADNFRTIVNQTLIKHSDKFKKVSRGQYTSK